MSLLILGERIGAVSIFLGEIMPRYLGLGGLYDLTCYSITIYYYCAWSSLALFPKVGRKSFLSIFPFYFLPLAKCE
jgi:hypothetical protein